MNTLLILLIIFVLYCIYKEKKNILHLKSNKKKKLELFSDVSSIESNDDLSSFNVDSLESDSQFSIDEEVKDNKKINYQYLNNLQYNSEFEDVINAIKIMPVNRKIFNLEILPVVFKKINTDNFDKKICDNFISQLNEYIENNIIVSTSFKSGWEKVQNKLGLPVLYQKENNKSVITSYEINSIKQFETKNQIKYVFRLVMNKENVSDKMIIDVSIVNNKIFDKKTTLESIFIIGYLSNVKNNLTAYNTLNYNKNIPDNNDLSKQIGEKFVKKELYKRYKKQICDEGLDNLNIDKEGRVFNYSILKRMI